MHNVSNANTRGKQNGQQIGPKALLKLLIHREQVDKNKVEPNQEKEKFSHIALQKVQRAKRQTTRPYPQNKEKH